MRTWRGRVRIGLAIFMVGFAAVVYFAIRKRETPVAATPGAPAAPGVVVESRGARVTRFKLSRQDVEVESARQLTFEDGSTKLEVVTVRVNQRQGRDFELTAAEAKIGPNQNSFDVRGDVRLKASDGLAVATDHASYEAQEAVLRADGPVRFSRGQMTGTSHGATYDRNRDVLWLLDQAKVKVGAEGGALPIEVSSGSAELARRDNYMRFDRGARMLREGRLVESDTATAHFRPGTQTLELMELRGGAQITGGPGGSGALKTMRSQDMNLGYGPDGVSLTQALLSGAGVIEMRGAEGQADRRISADWIDVRLAPDGATLVGMSARDRVQLQLPADAGGGAGAAPSRLIRSTRLEATGAPGQGLTAAKFIEAVEYREARPAARGAAASERIATARLLELALKGGFSSIDEARFSDDVTFSDGQWRAQAQRARYLVTRESVELTIPEGQTVRPRVTDKDVAIEGRSILLALDGHKMTADQDVRTEMKSDPGPPGATPDPDATHVPALLTKGQPVYVTAQHLEYDSAAGNAVYTGAARLWQGDTAIQADSLTLDNRTGNLTGRGSARSTLMTVRTDPKTNATEKTPTVARGDEMHYEDARRRVTYTTKAHVTGPQGDLTGNRIEMYLGTTGNELERVEAYDEVSLRLEERSATGSRLTYFAPDERYVMTGTPVRIVKECLVTTGEILTFFRSTDTISVDGTEGRTQTTGVDCPDKTAGP